MAYQARRKKIYTEDFLLTEEDGTVVKTLHVSLDADSMVKKLSEKQIELINAMRCVQGASADENGLEVLGNTVISMLEAVFGAEDAKTILDFYNNRYIELCQEVVPFITDIVIPEVRKIARQNKKALLAKYDRRKFGR